MSNPILSIFRFDKISAQVWPVLAALVILGAVLFVLSRQQQKWSARMIANAALSIALAFILSYVRLYKMPQGGSITLASMLPLFLFAYAYGMAPGFLVGAAYGLLQFMQDAYFVHPIELLLDYPLAFAMLGLAGLAHRKDGQFRLVQGIVLGALGRFLCAFIAGIVFFGSYAPEGQPVVVYSMVYNGLYLIPDTLICVALVLVPAMRRLARALTLSELRA